RNIAGYRNPLDVARREEFKFRLAHEALSSISLFQSRRSTDLDSHLGVSNSKGDYRSDTLVWNQVFRKIDFLNTGPSVAGTLRRQLSRWNNIHRLSNVTVTDIVTREGAAVGAVAINIINSE